MIRTALSLSLLVTTLKAAPISHYRAVSRRVPVRFDNCGQTTFPVCVSAKAKGDRCRGQDWLMTDGRYHRAAIVEVDGAWHLLQRGAGNRTWSTRLPRYPETCTDLGGRELYPCGRLMGWSEDLERLRDDHVMLPLVGTTTERRANE